MQSNNLFDKHSVVILSDVYIVSILKLWFLDVAYGISSSVILIGKFFFLWEGILLRLQHLSVCTLDACFKGMVSGYWDVHLFRHFLASQSLSRSCWHLWAQLGIDGQLFMWPACLYNSATAQERLLAFSFHISFALHIPPSAWRFSLTCCNVEEPLDLDLSTLTSPLRCKCRLVINWPC